MLGFPPVDSFPWINPLISMKSRLILGTLASLFPGTLLGGIVSVEETNLEPDAPAIIEPNGEGADGIPFDEDVLAYSDRSHQHNGAVFNEFTGEPDKESNVIADLPEYLKGGDFVRFANDARDNADYSATVTADVPSHFYLLIDNRLDGVKGDASSPNTNDPVLGGSLQWVLDAPWKRMNTGISPGGRPDYTGADESGNGFGPGVGINQFYSVYQYAKPVTSVDVRNQGFNGGSMICVVAVPAEDTTLQAASLFQASRSSIAFGETASLRFLIDPAATVATIEPGVGDILGQLDADGFGSVDLQPATDTTYTLHVESPAGTVDLTATVVVNLLNGFTAGSTLVEEGRAVELRWTVRPDAQVVLEPGIGDVSDRVQPDGTGAISVVPDSDTTYTLTVTGSDRTATAEVAIAVEPATGNEAKRFALVDVGATNGGVEPGAAGNQVVGGGTSGVNGANVENVILTSDDGIEFFVSIDNVAPDGNVIGRVDWRDRGGDNNEPLAQLARDFTKNNNGMLRVTLAGLPAGAYEMTSFHIDPSFSQAEAIQIGITDADGVNRSAGVIGSAFFDEGTIPEVAGLTTAIVEERSATYSITSNGTDPILIYFDATAATDKEVPVSGFLLETPAESATTTFALLDIGATNGGPEPGAAGNAVLGGGTSGANGPTLENEIVTSNDGIEFFVSLDSTGPDGSVIGRVDWRDRGGDNNEPLAQLARDFTKNNNGMLRLTLAGLPEGAYILTSYHIDPSFSQAEAIRIGVTDADGVNREAGVTGSAFFEEGTIPEVAGLTTAIVEERSATFTVTSNGTDPVLIYFDATAATDKEVPLSGLSIETEAAVEALATFALMDIGATGGQAESGAVGDQLGGGASGTNGADLAPTILTSDSGREFTLSIDALDPTGAVVGRLDWRDRGDAPATPLAMLGEDFLKNNNGMVRVVLSGLPEATYEVTSFHVDPDFAQCEAIRILVTDATGTAQDAGVTASAFFEEDAIPTVAGLAESVVRDHSATFSIVANGTDDVVIYFDGRDAADTEVPLSGLLLRSAQVSDVTPILSFLSVPTEIGFGDEAALRWRIDPKATSAVIEPGVGDILAQTDANGSGTIMVMPATDTVYTMTVEAPSGTAEASTEVLVDLVSDFASDSTFLSDGASATLTWSVRPGASVTITPGFGNVDPLTDEQGNGSLSVSPNRTTTYTITVSGSGREAQSTITISVEPQGTPFALLDIGALDGTVDSEATLQEQIGAGFHNENGITLFDPIDIVSDTNSPFTIQIDNLNPAGEEVGRIDWRNRGVAFDMPLAHLGEDFVKNSLGMIRVVLGGLPAGDYNLASYHFDASFSQSEAIRILVTDANGVARDAGVQGDASFEGDAPGAAGITTEIMQEHSTAFTVSSNGVDPVIIYFDGTLAFDDEVPLNGLLILQDSTLSRIKITQVGRDEVGNVSLDWESTSGQFFDIQKSLTLLPDSWETLVEGLPASADESGITSVLLEDAGLEPVAYYRVGLGRIPAALSEDFEDGAEGWETGIIDGGADTGTAWELGTPVGGPGMAHGGTQAFGTDLDGDYADGSLIYLRSPLIDPAGVRNLRLEFWYFMDAVAGEGGRVNVLAEDGTVLEFLNPVFDGATSNTQEWTLSTFRLPNLEQSFRIEFQLLSAPDGNPDNGAGWFIDDVRISK